ncbi:MAG: trehalase-like domain-containing protein, partial [Acidimicrobiales bacterium]
MSSPPISDLALISDCHSAALTSREGSVEWLCLPRFDSPSLFGHLLDDQAGYWSIRPVDEFTVVRRYLEGTMVLETTFTTETGTATLSDALALGNRARGHDLGEGAPALLVRELRGVAGQVSFVTEYVPRGEYGLIWPLLNLVDGGVAGRGGADVTMLSTGARLSIEPGAATGTVNVSAGDVVSFGLHYKRAEQELPRLWTQSELSKRLEDTIAAWRSWSELHQSYDGPWRELVHHSGRVLQALTYYPTGAMVAAPTTSLPESPGGTRNWDY